MTSDSIDGGADQLARAYQELTDLRKRIADIRAAAPPEPVENYEFKDGDGKSVKLYDLFGDKNDLIVIHNMGEGCRYCTLWADGFNGVYQHLEDRAGLAVVSPDAPQVMKAFAKGRGWKFRMLSNDSGSFTKAMGYEDEKGSPQPGMSTFHRDADGRVTRIAHAPFGSGDDFCAVWHMFDMLKDGPNGWAPKYEY